MENGLFGIFQSRDIYFTLDMYRVLSRSQSAKQTATNSKKQDEDGGEEQKAS